MAPNENILIIITSLFLIM